VYRFRLAALQLKRLQSKRLLLSSDIEIVLKSLPNDINSMYDKILQEDVHEDHRHLALRVLRWLAVSYGPPLTIEELSEVCTIPPESELGKSGVLGKDRFTLKQLLNLLPDLVMWDSSSRARIKSLELAHFSVREYLTGPQLLETPSVHSGVQLRDFHRLVAKECLAYLYLSREMRPKGALKDYAMENWQLHAVTTGKMDDNTRRDAFMLSASIASGDLSTLKQQLPKEFARLTQWLEDPEQIHSLITVLRVSSASRSNPFLFSFSDTAAVARLAILYPQDGDDPVIRCMVHKVHRRYVPSYEAIYCSWGRSPCTQEISLNGLPFDVPLDGFQTLRNLRQGITTVRLIRLESNGVQPLEDILTGHDSREGDNHLQYISFQLCRKAERIAVYLLGKIDKEEQRLHRAGGSDVRVGESPSFVPASTSGHCPEDHLTALETFFSEQRWCQIVARFLFAHDVVFFYGSHELSLDGIRDSLIRSGPFELNLDDVQAILDHRQICSNSTEIGKLLGGLGVDDVSELLNRPCYPHEPTCGGDDRDLQERRARILIESGMAKPTAVAQALKHPDPHTGHVELNSRLREDALGRARAIVDYLYQRKKRMATR
jgi:hypothetical protein